MSLDLLGLCLLLLATAGGALTGALRQVVHLVAVGGAAVLGPRLGPPLEGLVGGLVPARAVPAAAALAGFLLLFVALSLAGHLALRLLRGEGKRSAADRGLGALLGGLQAALGIWAVLSLLVIWDRPVVAGPLRVDPRDGQLAAVAREHNLLDLAAPAQARELRRKIPQLRDALDGKRLQGAPGRR